MLEKILSFSLIQTYTYPIVFWTILLLIIATITIQDIKEKEIPDLYFFFLTATILIFSPEKTYLHLIQSFGVAYIAKIILENIIFILKIKNFEIGEADIIYIAILSVTLTPMQTSLLIYTTLLFFLTYQLYIYSKTRKVEYISVAFIPYITSAYILIQIVITYLITTSRNPIGLAVG